VQEGWRVKKEQHLILGKKCLVITAVHNEKKRSNRIFKVTQFNGKKSHGRCAKRKKAWNLSKKILSFQRNEQGAAIICLHFQAMILQEPLRKIQTFASAINRKDKDTLSKMEKYLLNVCKLFCRTDAVVD